MIPSFSSLFSDPYSTAILAFRSPNPRRRWHEFFKDFRQAVRLNEISGVDGPIARQYLDVLKVLSLLIEEKFQVNSRIRSLLSEWIYLSFRSLPVLY